MAVETKPLHVVLLPYSANGHFVPVLRLANLFHSHSLKTTIITTPHFGDAVRKSAPHTQLHLLDFPPKGSSLPPNITAIDNALTDPELEFQFMKAMDLLQQPIEALLQHLSPDCVVSDAFFPWTTDWCAKSGIPRLLLHVSSCLAQCAQEQLQLTKPYNNVSSDSQPFLLPNLPHRMEFVRTQMSPFDLSPDEGIFMGLIDKLKASLKGSYGVVFDTFSEIESDYLDHYRKLLGIRVWHLGPLQLSTKPSYQKPQNGVQKRDDTEANLLNFLNAKNTHSVVYICMGSTATLTHAQLHELAVGIESAGHNFIWVLRKLDHENEDKWLPQGFRDRTKEKGMIFGGWAPQEKILEHPAIGAFMTHCGWNSVVETISMGVPMVAWPLFADQFYNEKLIVDVVRIGVSVGSKKWERIGNEGVGREAIKNAVERVMGEEGEELRSRAEGYRAMARKAVEEGGSSYSSMLALISDLNQYRATRNATLK